ncbi:plantaricin C family lantibiotic [Nocardiopsis aegyptia]|uniref:Plantaricin C family lantibiotic n=1 Tax=Nocardiopsis aegyptia TaxID=220378 RepID=A0A7Z0JBN2_9ACTN|nr:plantaricin C family lantibiotic [Nocardiopsis aegyptia]NYJ35614.1 hypothetical protein [Nocardiopsis aegyptia]
MPNMNASIFEEIQDQKLDSVFAGEAANPDSLWTTQSIAWCIVSPLAGNPGQVCTVTVECQDVC